MSWLRRFCLSALMSFITMTVINASVLVTLATESVAQSVPPDLPLAIICWNEGTQVWGIAYLAQVRKDGSATYLPPTGQLAATVNAKRMVEPPQNRPAVFDCFGKTLDELRAIGRIIEFQRTR
jgi:hypothetical protein